MDEKCEMHSLCPFILPLNNALLLSLHIVLLALLQFTTMPIKMLVPSINVSLENSTKLQRKEGKRFTFFRDSPLDCSEPVHMEECQSAAGINHIVRKSAALMIAQMKMTGQWMFIEMMMRIPAAMRRRVMIEIGGLSRWRQAWLQLQYLRG